MSRRYVRGAVGSLLCYLVTHGSEKYDGHFPFATFAINLTGSFFIGLLMVMNSSLAFGYAISGVALGWAGCGAGAMVAGFLSQIRSG